MSNVPTINLSVPSATTIKISTPGSDGGSADLSNYYTKEEADKKYNNIKATAEKVQNKTLGGNMPITLAYKENTGLISDNYYPSLKYLAESFEFFRNEIGEDYATKEEMGDIAEATAVIIALQNKYIGGESS